MSSRASDTSTTDKPDHCPEGRKARRLPAQETARNPLSRQELPEGGAGHNQPGRGGTKPTGRVAFVPGAWGVADRLVLQEEAGGGPPTSGGTGKIGCHPRGPMWRTRTEQLLGRSNFSAGRLEGLTFKPNQPSLAGRPLSGHGREARALSEAGRSLEPKALPRPGSRTA